MGIEERMKKIQDERGSTPESLYEILKTDEFNQGDNYKRDSLGEDMEVVSEVIASYWKPRFLVDNAARRAYVFMSRNEHLYDVGDEDIDWASLQRISKREREECIEMAKSRNAMYPTFIGDFSNGIARVSWQLQPNGYYWMDEDGFGMTGDEEITVHGFIDRTCRVVFPFRFVRGYNELDGLRPQAEEIVKSGVLPKTSKKDVG